MQRVIVCFGDSNTYGESPEGFGRYPRDERWTGILQKKLGDQYYVIEEGLNGRTTVWSDPVEGDKSGLRHLRPILLSHVPIDLLIIMLGTNDLKHRFSVTPTDIALSAERLVTEAKRIENGPDGKPFKILLISPPVIQEETFLGDVFGNRREDAKQFGDLYAAVAKRQHVEFLDIAKYAETPKLDGLHFDRPNHQKVADALEQKIKAIFSE